MLLVCAQTTGSIVLYSLAALVSLNQRSPLHSWLILPRTCMGSPCLRNRNRSAFTSFKIIFLDNF